MNKKHNPSKEKLRPRSQLPMPKPPPKQPASSAVPIPRIVSAYQETRILMGGNWSSTPATFIIASFDDGSTWEAPHITNEGRWRCVVPSREALQRDFNTFFALTQQSPQTGDNGSKEGN